MHRIKKGSNFAPQLRDKPLHNEPRKLTAKAVPEMQNNDDSLAQLVEHNTFNVGVLGSNPRRITKRKGHFYNDLFLYAGTTLNSIFCRNCGYNRKKLYLCGLLIEIFCMAVKVDTLSVPERG